MNTAEMAAKIAAYTSALEAAGVPPEAIGAIVFDFAQQLHRGATFDTAPTKPDLAAAAAQRRQQRANELAALGE